MTVLELKQILSSYDDDVEIFVDMLTDDQYEQDNIWVTDVRTPYDPDKLRRVMDNKQAQRACKETAGATKCLIL